jgi:hypothetical protein
VNLHLQVDLEDEHTVTQTLYSSHRRRFARGTPRI